MAVLNDTTITARTVRRMVVSSRADFVRRPSKLRSRIDQSDGQNTTRKLASAGHACSPASSSYEYAYAVGQRAWTRLTYSVRVTPSGSVVARHASGVMQPLAIVHCPLIGAIGVGQHRCKPGSCDSG